MVPTADLVTAKLHCNRIMVSTALAKYICIDIKKVYLTANLEYIEYMIYFQIGL